jgi:hypothetical protein
LPSIGFTAAQPTAVQPLTLIDLAARRGSYKRIGAGAIVPRSTGDDRAETQNPPLGRVMSGEAGREKKRKIILAD